MTNDHSEPGLFGGMVAEHMIRAAQISPCGRYRYRLMRTWDAALPVAYWIMLNPSTADALDDDPMTRRCIGFARSWGCGGIDVRNLFGLRATDPRVVAKHAEPVGSENNAHLLDLLSSPRLIVAAWGASGVIRDRHREVLRLLNAFDGTLSCLGTTKSGYPLHPLYLPASQQLRPFAVEE